MLGLKLGRDGLERQPRADRRRAIADQAGEVVDVPGIAGLGDQVQPASGCRSRSGGGVPRRPPSAIGIARSLRPNCPIREDQD